MVLEFSQALAQQGVAVTLLTTDANGDAGQPPLDVPLDRPIFQNGYHIRYFHCAPWRRYKFSLDLLRWLFVHAQEFHLAHIHALFSPVSSVAAAIARTQNLPYVLRPLGTLDPADLQKKRQLKQIYAALLEQSNLQRAAALHFTSQQEAEVSHRFGSNAKTMILPIGITPLPALADPTAVLNQLQIPKTNPVHCPLMLFLSRLAPKKGLHLLLPALETLLAEGFKFHFVLAGSNPQAPHYEQQIHAQIQSSPLSQHTSILGFVSGSAKAALLQSADLFVLPSQYENFGIAVAEAMMAGLSVVVSDRVSLSPEIQQAQAGWITAANVAALTNGLRSALSDPTERQRRGRLAQTYAFAHFRWEAIAHQAVQQYHEILKSIAKGSGEST
jgi:glycosyltransferase involved in cell wall biosynthesis